MSARGIRFMGEKRTDLHQGLRLFYMLVDSDCVISSSVPQFLRPQNRDCLCIFLLYQLSVFNSPGIWALLESVTTTGPSIPLGGRLDIHIKLWPQMHSEVPRLHLHDWSRFYSWDVLPSLS